MDFQAKLSSLTTAPCQQNYDSMDKVQPRVWYQRRQGNTNLYLDGSPADGETTYEVQVDSLDPDAGASIAETLRGQPPSGLHGFRGAMGGTVVLGMFAEDASDDFAFRGVSLDDGYHSFGFTVRVLT